MGKGESGHRLAPRKNGATYIRVQKFCLILPLKVPTGGSRGEGLEDMGKIRDGCISGKEPKIGTPGPWVKFNVASSLPSCLQCSGSLKVQINLSHSCPLATTMDSLPLTFPFEACGIINEICIIFCHINALKLGPHILSTSKLIYTFPGGISMQLNDVSHQELLGEAQ